jgi:hypothetical protein
MPVNKPPTPVKEEFIAFLNEKWKGARCPMCGTANWQVAEGVFQLMQFAGGALIVGGGPVVPVVPVTCGNCGNTVMVNAIVSRVMPLQGSPSEQPSGSNPKSSAGGTP